MQKKEYMTKCPVCKNDSLKITSLIEEDCKKRLAEYFECYPNIPIGDYELYKCNGCELEYSNPMVPGSDKFYAWITSQTNYYPHLRWEWNLFENLVFHSAKKEKIKLMDIGAGTGKFLGLLSPKNYDVKGIDLNEQSVYACREKGLDVYKATIEEYRKKFPDELFDIATAFHTLEHVEDPVGFMKSVREIISEDGKIIVSTPYSPMSFESKWFDPLNMPPHHLTRWNKRSFEALAESIGMELDLITSPPKSLLRRSVHAVALRNKKKLSSKIRIFDLINIIFHPVEIFSELLSQKQRECLNGAVAGDVALAVFSNRNA